MGDEVKIKRDLILGSNVYESTVQTLTERIIEINRHDDEQEGRLKGYERKPIELIVNTYGGSLYDGFGLVGIINKSTTPVYTYCYGKAMSMGFMIFIAGKKRFIHPLGTLMYHEASKYINGELEHIKQELRETERLMNLYDNYVINRTNLRQKDLDEIKRSRGEWYIDAEEAIKNGIADEIVLWF